MKSLEKLFILAATAILVTTALAAGAAERTPRMKMTIENMDSG
jgi:hypothetical protein